jgi:DNA-binding transcriptional regulator YhcF (GntR family)
MSMNFTIDRALPIPIRQQLKGLIEYGIACGDLAPGQGLPSVRDLARSLGVAPLTVSKVYADLKKLGLVATQAGARTLVAEKDAEPHPGGAGLAALHGRIDALIEEGLSLGLRTPELAAMIHARLAAHTRPRRGASVVMVGLFPAATARYARLIAGQLGRRATVRPVTIDTLRRKPALQARIASADLVVTFVNRRHEVSQLLPGADVIAIRFVPATETRIALAAIPAGTRILLAAHLPEFLPIMKAGVARFVEPGCTIAAMAGDPESLADQAAQAGILVYASGTEEALLHVPPSLPVIEYRHIPDPADVAGRIAARLPSSPADGGRICPEPAGQISTSA